MTQADHWVYQCFGAKDRLLYVGLTSHGLRRFADGHARFAEWWPQVATVKVEHFPTRAKAASHERVLIDQLDPPYNGTRPPRVVPAPLKDPLPTSWHTTGQLAKQLEVDLETVSEFMDRGMPHAIIAGKVRFKLAEVRAWLRPRKAELPPGGSEGG